MPAPEPGGAGRRGGGAGGGGERRTSQLPRCCALARGGRGGGSPVAGFGGGGGGLVVAAVAEGVPFPSVGTSQPHAGPPPARRRASLPPARRLARRSCAQSSPFPGSRARGGAEKRTQERPADSLLNLMWVTLGISVYNLGLTSALTRDSYVISGPGQVDAPDNL
nr:uncharacterized protein LOC110548864 [Meriones unguiculatus]